MNTVSRENVSIFIPLSLSDPTEHHNKSLHLYQIWILVNAYKIPQRTKYYIL